MLILLYLLLKNDRVDLGSLHLDLIRLGGQIIKFEKKHDKKVNYESIDVVDTKKDRFIYHWNQFRRKIYAYFLHNMMKILPLLLTQGCKS